VQAMAFWGVVSFAITATFSDDSSSLREIRIGRGIFCAFFMITSVE
jgi:hypothetical protein